MDDGRVKTRCGKFGYEIINDNHIIPYIFRYDDKYTATKVFAWHFDQLKINCAPDLIDFRYLRGYEMYRDEAALLNEINHFHNDSVYPFVFNRNDTLVKLHDLYEIFKYINDCTQKNKFGHRFDMMAGMVRVRFPSPNSDVILPYVLKNEIRYTPIQVFLNAPQTLSDTAILTDIEVMYMRYIYAMLKMDNPNKTFQMPCVALYEAMAHIIGNVDDDYDFDDNYWPSKEDSPKNLNNNHVPFFIRAQTNSKSLEQDKQMDQVKQVFIE